MSTKDDALWETMCECVFGSTWTGAQASAMRRALAVARKAILEEAASALRDEMIRDPKVNGGDRQYNAAIGRCVAVIIALSTQEQPQ